VLEETFSGGLKASGEQYIVAGGFFKFPREVPVLANLYTIVVPFTNNPLCFGQDREKHPSTLPFGILVTYGAPRVWKRVLRIIVEVAGRMWVHILHSIVQQGLHKSDFRLFFGFDRAICLRTNASGYLFLYYLVG
jgi:hypothetical protein